MKLSVPHNAHLMGVTMARKAARLAGNAVPHIARPTGGAMARAVQKLHPQAKAK